VFKKVLIANRGAIAVRILRSLRKLGVSSVVVYAESDKDSLHVSLADEAYSLGEGPAASTYLNQNKLFHIVKTTGAEAIHPGYGFLSENAEFARRCEAEGVVFLGPTAEHIEAFGLKHRARELAQASNVPLLPGTDLLTSCVQAQQAANDIGYPVMLKSTAGGGGIGMSICHSQQELVAAYDSVKRLSENNFGDDGVFLEKYISHARHIEVQVLADGKGQAMTLGERDCSAQRRNQKVIEETPAPNLSDDARQALAKAAHDLLANNSYRSAGTVEFIFDQSSGSFYFLEVNTRLQVEHGVTEEIFGIDLVEWMVRIGADDLANFEKVKQGLSSKGHAIQVRLYAEDANKNFQPSAGLLSHVEWPAQESGLRIDTWVEAGVNVPPFFDPMLGKLIVKADTRELALQKLDKALSGSAIYGIETNLAYVLQVLKLDVFQQGNISTRYLNDFNYAPSTVDVLSGGTQTTIQDYPGRRGYWSVGVPPSGPFDSRSFRLANQLVCNEDSAAGLEITLQGPKLRFNRQTTIALTGATLDAKIIKADGTESSCPFWQQVTLNAGDSLHCGKVVESGSRAYLAVAGGIECPNYMGSKSTFTLGQFGGHAGRALAAGDVLHLSENTLCAAEAIAAELVPEFTSEWVLRVVYGPHGAPDFFTEKDIATFFDASWKVHYNSSRTGIRLIGPKPDWARSDGGEAGMHPSNIHDNAYAFGTVDFTGDMPVILGPDGPSLGGFVCPATVITADLWKLGQLKAGDTIRFEPVSVDDAVRIEQSQNISISQLKEQASLDIKTAEPTSCVLKRLEPKTAPNGTVLPEVCYRVQGDHFLLVEYGELKLDIALRFRVHALYLWLEKNPLEGIEDITPGVRSLQVHYDSQILSLQRLLVHLEQAEHLLDDDPNPEVTARRVHIPLSWDDEACKQAIEKYMQSVRADAPWCPSNIEFIRRINGLDSIDEVKRIVFEANYLVLGLGDVYLGAPVATPVDPRHRLVTTKYNPARTWTAENSVGIGGSYMCVYGMEGPGGYQFVGRTVQMWNRYRSTASFKEGKPWLLRFFDQISYYPVTAEELLELRKDFPEGRFEPKIEEGHFSLGEYEAFLKENESTITEFKSKQ